MITSVLGWLLDLALWVSFDRCLTDLLCWASQRCWLNLGSLTLVGLRLGLLRLRVLLRLVGGGGVQTCWRHLGVGKGLGVLGTWLGSVDGGSGGQY